MKPTLVIGASENPERYSNMAIHNLRRYQHPVYAIGLREGKVEDVPIVKNTPEWKDVHTVTLYLNPARQPAYYDYIIGLKPERVIFNPGAENQVFEALLAKQGIKTEEACTLVLLNTGQY